MSFSRSEVHSCPRAFWLGALDHGSPFYTHYHTRQATSQHANRTCTQHNEYHTFSFSYNVRQQTRLHRHRSTVGCGKLLTAQHLRCLVFFRFGSLDCDAAGVGEPLSSIPCCAPWPLATWRIGSFLEAIRGGDTGRLSRFELLILAVRAGGDILADMREHLWPNITVANFPPCVLDVEVARRSVDMTVP